MTAKKFTLLTLFTLFCATSATNTLANSFHGISSYGRSFYQWICNHKVETSVIALSALALAVVYWLRKSEPTTSIAPNNYPEVPVTQIPVLKQSSDATCAYHSLKNGLLFYQIAQQNIWIDQNQSTLLQDSQYFSEQLTTWKAAVIQERKKIALEEFLSSEFINKLLVSLNDFKIKPEIAALEQQLQAPYQSEDAVFSNKLHGLFVQKLKDIAKGLASTIVDGKSQELPITVDWAYLQKPLNQNLHEITNTINNYFSISDESLKTTVQETVKNTSLYINDNNLSIEINEKLIQLQFDQKHSSSPDEWLRGGAIEHLLKKESNLENVRNCFTVIDDINQTEIIFDHDTRTKWLSKPNTTHIFFMGTMNQNNPDMGGHWFVLVVQKLKNEKRYFVADSLGIDRTNDERVLKIIHMLNPEQNAPQTTSMTSSINDLN